MIKYRYEVVSTQYIDVVLESDSVPAKGNQRNRSRLTTDSNALFCGNRHDPKNPIIA